MDFRLKKLLIRRRQSLRVRINKKEDTGVTYNMTDRSGIFGL